MKNENNHRIILGRRSICLFCLCSVVFAIVGIITFRDYGNGSWLCRTNWFWWRFLWFEAIFGLFWFSVICLPISRLLQNRDMTGATYAIVASICFRASLVSFVIWSIASFVPTNTFFSILPVAIQLLVILYYGVVSFMFPKAQVFQADGMTRFQEAGIPCPRELACKLEYLEKKMGTCHDAVLIKRLKEKIRYSIPMVGRVADCSAYKQLVDAVFSIVENPSADIAQLNDEMMTLIFQIIELCKQ